MALTANNAQTREISSEDLRPIPSLAERFTREMPKHPRKKQKTVISEAKPLGSRDPNVDDDAEKDEEERRLESILFGKPFVAGSSKGREIIVVDDEGGAGSDEVGGGAAFEQLEDKDVREMA